MFSDLFPLVIPALALLIPVAVVGFHYASKTRVERERHETIREIVRAGQPIPPELLEPVDSGWSSARRESVDPNRMLIPGVVNVFAGLGLAGMFAVMRPGAWLWAIGLLPFSVGLGFVVFWLMVRKSQSPQP